MAKVLYIVRGCSGSGKSTLAKQLVDRDPNKVFSTDDFFMKTGKYHFDSAKLAQAHRWNQERVQEAMRSATTPIVVDNTHTTLWEARPYVVMAREYGYSIEFREPDTEWRFDATELARRNVHGVPLDAIQKMLKRYVPLNKFTVDAILQSRAPWER
jgi:NEDD4-binding protein 2